MQSIFSISTEKTIGGQTVHLSKIPFEAFEDALTFGEWLQASGQSGIPDLSALQRLRADTPERGALERLLAVCIAVERDGQARQLTVQDVRQMPVATVLEATYVVIEDNTDFFMQALETIQAIQRRLTLIGSPSHSSSSQQGTTGSKSGATASPS